jgi:hypothetical protein
MKPGQQDRIRFPEAMLPVQPFDDFRDSEV